MNFLTADDMSAVLIAKLRKLGFGIVTKLHLTGMHVEGKVCTSEAELIYIELLSVEEIVTHPLGNW